MAPDENKPWWKSPGRFELTRLLKQTAQEWYSDGTFELGAALAFYGVFSIAPIVLMSIAVAGLVLGRPEAEHRVIHQLKDTVGSTVAEAIAGTLQYGYRSGSSQVATVLSVVVFLIGAAGLFNQLQSALNKIWDVRPMPGRRWLDVVKDRFLSFVAVLCTSALLLAALLANASFAALGHFMGSSDILRDLHWWRILNHVVSFALLTLALALIYELLPDAKIAWRDVWVGAAVSAVLFLIGSYLIGLYLEWSGTTSAYGAVGSIVVLLLWIYYSAQVLLFGAEFTQVYARRGGKPVEPSEHARSVCG